VEIKNLGKVTKCMNPEKDCPNVPDPATAYVVVYQGKPLVLCKACGPAIKVELAKVVAQERKTKMVVPKYWFAVKLSFTCPTCTKPSEEVLFTRAGRPEPDRIAQVAATQRPKCQRCGLWLSEDGTKVLINVLPVTLKQAKAMGFKPAPGTPL